MSTTDLETISGVMFRSERLVLHKVSLSILDSISIGDIAHVYAIGTNFQTKRIDGQIILFLNLHFEESNFFSD